MAAIDIKVFSGMLPSLDDTLIPDQYAAYSLDVWLYDGTLIGFPAIKVLKALGATTTKVYRLPELYTNARNLYDASFWMQFQNSDTDVVRAPVFGETFDRYYWASTADVPRYNTRARIVAGSAAWKLGLPLPVSLTVVPSGGVGAAVNRTYGITRVSAYGEEGPMKVSANTAGKVDDTWVLTIPAVSGADDGGVGDDRNITLTNIYRTVVGSSGVASYFFVAQIAGSAITYSDTALDAVIALNAINESLLWSAPPADLKGLTMMPNGIVAGWRENEVWFSEPYRPHAWPAAYVLTVEYPIVGMGIINQTLVVMTTGFPVTMTGAHPAYITSAKLNNFEPCTSRGGIISAPEGVYYPSPNGLILVTLGQAQNITKDLINRDKWLQLTKSTAFKAARLGTAYYAFGSVTLGVFEDTAFDTSLSTGSFALEDFAGSYLGVLIDPQNARVGFNLLSSPVPMYNVLNDPWSGSLFLIRNSQVEWLDQSDVLSVKQPYTWYSKIFQANDKKNFAVARVYFDIPVGITSNYATMTLTADGRDVLVRPITYSGELLRFPSGFKADYWQLKLTAQVKIKNIQMASSVRELKRV